MVVRGDISPRLITGAKKERICCCTCHCTRFYTTPLEILGGGSSPPAPPVPTPLMTNSSIPRFYFSAQIILFMIAIIHIILQPYKKNWHNILELCIMVDLLFLNSAAYIKSNYFLSKYRHILPTIGWINSIEMFLLGLPLVYLVCYIAVTIYQKVLPLQCCLQIIRRRMNHPALENSEEAFPARLLDRFSDNYKTF